MARGREGERPDRRGSRWDPLRGMGLPADSPGGCANAFIFSPLR